MPIYEYECSRCGHRLEALQKISDAPLSECPACHEAALTKLISASNFRLKGAGWYETDFKKEGRKQLAETDSAEKGGKDSAGSEAGEKAGSKAEDKADNRSENRSENKSENKAENKPAKTQSSESTGKNKPGKPGKTGAADG